MRDPFIDVCKGVSHPRGLISVIPLVTIGSTREWIGDFLKYLTHPWANSERQVAQEKFLEDSMSNHLENCPKHLSILAHHIL